MTILRDTIDLQATTPSIELGIDEVGVTGVVRGIILGDAALPTTARFDVATSLGSESRGAHMSRFHEAIDHALTLVGEEGRNVPSLEVLAMVIASRAADLQEAGHARASVQATIAWPRIAPASSRRTIDPFDVWATVELDRTSQTPRTQVTLGVVAVGMTACPCAQNLVRESARARLMQAGMDEDAIGTVLDELPVATHNQRSTGSLAITIPGDGAVAAVADPFLLADLVRGSMSAPIHELLKRDDELAVVEAAHADPRFVEDCVRALVRDVLVLDEVGAALPPQATVRVHQVNHESIHAHDVVARCEGNVAALREQLGIEITPVRA